MYQKDGEESMQSGEHMKKPMIWISSSTRTRTRGSQKLKGHACALYAHASVATHDFLIENGFTKGPKLVAGANFEFDKSFLSRLPHYKELNIGRRVLEPSHYTVDWNNDSILPSLFQCKERLGLEGGVAHSALADAWDVIQCLRSQYT